jgi:hypothetical protein
MTEEKNQPALRFLHVDDEQWQEIRAQQQGDRRVSIFEKWLEFTPNFLCLYAKWDPGLRLACGRSIPPAALPASWLDLRPGSLCIG